MKIKALRTMRLGGKRCEQGKTVDVSKADGELALRHKWAEKPAEKKEVNNDTNQDSGN